MNNLVLSRENKVGIAIPKKVAKLAIERNRIKREIMLWLHAWAKNNTSISVSLVVHSFSDPEQFKKSLFERIKSLS